MLKAFDISSAIARVAHVSPLDWIGDFLLYLLLKLPIGASIYYITFLYNEVVFYMYISTIRSCIKCCCHVWDSAPSCYLNMLIKLQNRNFEI